MGNLTAAVPNGVFPRAPASRSAWVRMPMKSAGDSGLMSATYSD
jgi:hypothetical protein